MSLKELLNEDVKEAVMQTPTIHVAGVPGVRGRKCGRDFERSLFYLG